MSSLDFGLHTFLFLLNFTPWLFVLCAYVLAACKRDIVNPNGENVVAINLKTFHQFLLKNH